MKKFLFFSLKVLLTPLIMIFINIIIDYRSEENGITKKFLQDLKKYDSLTLNVNFPERKFVKYRIINDNYSFSNIVLGSSRSMSIGKQTSNKVLNLSVSGAILKDYSEIFNLIQKQNRSVSSIIIEISPWIFNHNISEMRFQEFTESNSYRFLSYNYFLENIKFPKYTLVENKNSLRKYVDGSINYDETKIENYKEKIKNYIKGEVYHLEGFNSIKDLDIYKLVKFVEKVKNQGVELIFLKLPYPPSINSIIMERYPNILKTDEIINQISKKYGIKILGSFHPEEKNLSDKDFIDGMHLRLNGVKKLLKQNH